MVHQRHFLIMLLTQEPENFEAKSCETEVNQKHTSEHTILNIMQVIVLD